MPESFAFTLRVAVLELRGYREWTESLGDDREWLIQARQAELYSLLSVEAAGVGALTVPFRHDVHLVLASSVPHESLEYLAARAAEAAPTPVELRVGCGSTPAEAVSRAAKGVRRCASREAVVLAHIDINSITRLDRADGLYSSYLRITRLYARLVEELSEYGAIVSYLGGDNMLAVLPFNREALDVLEYVVEEEDAKAGVGVAAKPREAARLATKCLDAIRAGASESLLICKTVEGFP